MIRDCFIDYCPVRKIFRLTGHDELNPRVVMIFNSAEDLERRLPKYATEKVNYSIRAQDQLRIAGSAPSVAQVKPEG